MSRYTIAIVCLVLIGHVLVYGYTLSAEPATISGSSENQPQGEIIQMQQSQRSLDSEAGGKFHGIRAPVAMGNRGIDLTELTPSLEQQLFQARRLNSADPDSIKELSKLAADAYHYEMVANHQGGPEQDQSSNKNNYRMMAERLANSDRTGPLWLHIVNNVRRRSSGNNNYGTPTSPLNYNNHFHQRPTRGPASSGPNSWAADYGRAALDKEDKDYEIVAELQQQSRASPNQESAARKSLWTSELLRDLLIAQEERNREKKRRCKVDPNLGVKNPSYCDTDAYFGAADYGMRDVWDSAGR